MAQFVAKIRSKGLDATGVTEDVARQMYATLGAHTMMVVEVQHVKHSDDADGQHSVELVITTAEPAQDERMENHLRELARGMYRTRPEVQGQEVLAGVVDGPGLADTITEGAALLDRDENGDVVGIWDGDTEEEPSNVVEFSNGG